MAVQKIPTRKLGPNGPEVGVMALGLMGFHTFYGPTDEAELMKSLTHAADRGMTYWATSNIFINAEKIVGKWFAHTGRRSDVFLAASFGSYDPDKPISSGPAPDSSAAHMHKCIARSLEALQTNYVDIFYQGRVDPKIPIEVVLENLREYVDKGVIRWLGLSECSAEVLGRAKAVPGLGEKVVAVQREYGPFELGIEKDGFLQAAKELGVTLIAYSPLHRGLATGRFRSKADFAQNDMRRFFPRFSDENLPKNLELVDKLAEIGKKYNASSSQISLAWLVIENPYVIPEPGSRNVARTEENAVAAEIKLSAEDVQTIRTLCESADVQGDRVPQMAKAKMDCIPLEE